MHAVVVHPGLQGLVSGRLAGVVLELWCTRDNGVAPCVDYLPGVAGRERNGVSPGNRNASESEQRTRRRRTLRAAAEERGERNHKRTFQNATPGQTLGDHVGENLGLAVRRASDGHGSIPSEVTEARLLAIFPKGPALSPERLFAGLPTLRLRNDSLMTAAPPCGLPGDFEPG